MHRTSRRIWADRALALLPFWAALFAGSEMTQAHHTYAMFDRSSTRTVNGSVAKLEWKNPHVYLWVYVPSKEQAGKYDLWAFENGSPSVLSARGWNPTVLKPGDKITVEFWPLKDGGIGGHFEKVTLSDGHVLEGVGGPGRF
jgi:hypothetical protein